MNIFGTDVEDINNISWKNHFSNSEFSQLLTQLYFSLLKENRDPSEPWLISLKNILNSSSSPIDMLNKFWNSMIKILNNFIGKNKIESFSNQQIYDAFCNILQSLYQNLKDI